MDLPLRVVESLNESEMLLVAGGNFGLAEASTNNSSGVCSDTNNADGLCNGTNNYNGRCSGNNNGGGYCGTGLEPLSKPGHDGIKA